MNPQTVLCQPTGALLDACSELPSIIRYFNDFEDCYFSINNPKETDSWKISVNGKAQVLKFNCHGAELLPVLKCWAAALIQTRSITTVAAYFASLQRVATEDILTLVKCTPTNLRPYWHRWVAKGYTAHELTSLKSILYFFCRRNITDWSSDYTSFLTSLPLPAADKYASVRTGDVFLSLDEEAILIAYFDELTQLVNQNANSLSDKALLDVAILICSYQFGMRPLQISMLQMRDVQIWDEGSDSTSVHLTFKMIKQRSKRTSLLLPRKVKREWVRLFTELYNREVKNGSKGNDHFFRVRSAQETASIIVTTTGKLLPESRCATDLRHTAAQRLVDAGASQEELAEFLGHSDIDTGLVYFQTSANQAERVNQALGISKIYQNVAQIAHARFINLDELSSLKGECQIGGVPHGIPITGIGGCSSGQAACAYNPVMACYGCKKFMPLHDSQVHKRALADFRSIVSFFAESNRISSSSPTFLQLQKTIANVQSIIAEIESDHVE